MNFSQIIALCKMFTAMTEPNFRSQITRADFDLACEALKSMADNTNTWSNYDKERYKALVDFVKEIAKSNNYQV